MDRTPSTFAGTKSSPSPDAISFADAGLPRQHCLAVAEPAAFGQVASDPTISRLIARLAALGEKALTAIHAAFAGVGERICELADGQVTVNLDDVLVVAHSEKQDAAPT